MWIVLPTYDKHGCIPGVFRCPALVMGDHLEIVCRDLGCTLDRWLCPKWDSIVLAEILPNGAVPLDRPCTLEFGIGVTLAIPGALPGILKDNLDIMGVIPLHDFPQRPVDGQGFQGEKPSLPGVPYCHPGVSARINANADHLLSSLMG